MSEKDVYVVGAARTAVGSFQGMFSNTPCSTLGAVAIKEAVRRSGLAPDDVQEVFMGNVLTAGQGQAPGRQAAIYAGLPKSVPNTTVTKVCGSGAQAIILGARTIQLGENDLVVTGGMENMTLAPYALPLGRSGYRMGFTRQAQDDYAVESYKRAINATKEGHYAAEITPVVLKDKKKGDIELKIDEEPQKFNEEKMRALKPAFKKDGTVTAGNASSINDAGAALVLASEKAVKERGLKTLGRIAGWAVHAQEPEWFTTSPVFATRKVLERCGLKPSDIGLWEVNEAFAVVAMAAMKDVGIPHDRMNVGGSGCSIGHPIGCTGARIMVTLLYGMERLKAKKGLGTMCIGGGEAIAMVFEK
jgi:acetyl-CoA C-acetyltransferase